MRDAIAPREKARYLTAIGLFDYLTCNYPLPDPADGRAREGDYATVEFQTKDTPSQFMDEYTIDPAGRLLHADYDLVPTPEDEKVEIAPGIRIPLWNKVPLGMSEVPYDGELVFYGDLPGGRWVTYVAVFVGDRVRSIHCHGSRHVDL